MALKYAYYTTPGLKTLLGSAHGKLLNFGYMLEKTPIGQACVGVGETAERV